MLTSFPSIDTMERITREQLGKELEHILDRVQKENIAFVITDGGKPDLVLCPGTWFAPEAERGTERLEIEVESELLEKVGEIIRPLGFTHEMLVRRFLEFCTAPETRDRAAELLLQWKTEQEDGAARESRPEMPQP